MFQMRILKDQRQRQVAGVILVISLFLGIVFSAQALMLRRATAKARFALEMGRPAVASEWVDPYRFQLARTEKGCQALLDTYLAAKSPGNLAWTSEACLDSGIENPEIHMGLALSREMSGADQDAILILEAATKKFEKVPGLVLRIAQILKRNKNQEGATLYYSKAMELAPDNENIALESLGYFLESRQDESARLVATKLKNAKTDNPEVKLVIARGLLRGGDATGAKMITEEAVGLVATNTQLRQRLQSSYPDLLTPDVLSGQQKK